MKKSKKLAIVGSTMAFVTGAVATTAVILRKRNRRYIRK